MRYLKEDNPILRGTSPPVPPGIYRVKDKSMGEEQVRLRRTCPHASVTDCGARVASQRCPILRAGSKIISLPYKISTGRIVQHDTSFQRLIQETAIRALQQSVAADIKWLR